MRRAPRIATPFAWSTARVASLASPTITRRELARVAGIHHFRQLVREDATWAEPCVLTVCSSSRPRSRSAARVLDDGRYDAFVVWADARDDGVIELQLTITTGVHKGEVVELRATHLPVRDPFALVAMPCTLVVEDGAPRIEP